MQMLALTKTPLGYYKHSKSGRLYEVIHTAKHTETLETMVIYKACYASDAFHPDQLWVRSESMFNELVDIDGIRINRFVRLTSDLG
jgi:hypothetical protein